MQKTLEFYLKDRATSFEACDFVLSDLDDPNQSYQKPICKISSFCDKRADISRPITRFSLFEDLNNFYEKLDKQALHKIDIGTKDALPKTIQLPKSIDPSLKERIKKLQNLVSSFEKE